MAKNGLDMIIEAARELCKYENKKGSGTEDDDNEIERKEEYQRQTTEEER